MDIVEKFKKISTFILDVDGVLTDSMVLLLENGVQARRMNIKDGYALQLAVKKGYRVFVISGADSPQVRVRLEKLGIAEIHMGVLNKGELLESFLTRQQLNREEVLYMGDDMPDIPAMLAAGLAACPADAAEDVRQLAGYISPFTGGQGCVRDVIEKVLKLNNHWTETTSIASR